MFRILRVVMGSGEPLRVRVHTRTLRTHRSLLSNCFFVWSIFRTYWLTKWPVFGEEKYRENDYKPCPAKPQLGKGHDVFPTFGMHLLDNKWVSVPCYACTKGFKSNVCNSSWFTSQSQTLCGVNVNILARYKQQGAVNVSFSPSLFSLYLSQSISISP